MLLFFFKFGLVIQEMSFKDESLQTTGSWTTNDGKNTNQSQ